MICCSILRHWYKWDRWDTLWLLRVYSLCWKSLLNLSRILSLNRCTYQSRLYRWHYYYGSLDNCGQSDLSDVRKSLALPLISPYVMQMVLKALQASYVGDYATVTVIILVSHKFINKVFNSFRYTRLSSQRCSYLVSWPVYCSQINMVL